MREIIEDCKEFHEMIRHFTTRNEDDTTKEPSMDKIPFAHNGVVMNKVVDLTNEKYFSGLKIKCVRI